MRVVRVGHITIYVYVETGERHDRPHCNVRWSGLDANFAIDKPSAELLDGPRRIPKAVWDAVNANYVAIREAWNRLNPLRLVR